MIKKEKDKMLRVTSMINCPPTECVSTPCQFCAILSHSLTVSDLVTLVDSLS